MTDQTLWKRKAMAFAIRCHRHLWGKNNEDPLSFLYRQSISIDLSRSLYLGWNKFGQKRSLAGWGLKGEGDFLIPPGIVFPYIKEKELLALFVISMTRPYDRLMLPGSTPVPVVLGSLIPGSEETACKKTSPSLLQGLALFQENPGSCVTIPVATQGDA